MAPGRDLETWVIRPLRVVRISVLRVWRFFLPE
jgi:hypothetical protein